LVKPHRCDIRHLGVALATCLPEEHAIRAVTLVADHRTNRLATGHAIDDVSSCHDDLMAIKKPLPWLP